jgi:hypothetical protein
MHVLLTLIRQQLLQLVPLNLIRCRCLSEHVPIGRSMCAFLLLVLLLLPPLLLLLMRFAVAQQILFELIPVRHCSQ